MKFQLNNKHNVFFMSDPHYNHKQIVKGTSKWSHLGMCRPFETLEEHDNYLVNQINKTVGTDDTLILTGDFSFGEYKNNANIENVRIFRNKINCKNIHLWLGNHDQEIRDSKELQSLFSSVNQMSEIVITDYPPLEQGDKPEKYRIILCHFAMRVWNAASHGSWMLYGHSHGNLHSEYYDNQLTMDIGIDCHPDFRPFSFQEIKEIMSKRNHQLTVDHH